MKRNDDVVSASEIASWAWCPESWRLDALGAEPGNRAALRAGREVPRANGRVRGAVDGRPSQLGFWLLAAGLLLAALAFVLVRG